MSEQSADMTIQYTDPFGGINWLKTIFTWKGGIVQVLWLELLIATILLTITLTICYVMTNGSASKCIEYDWPQHILELAQILEFISERFQAAVGLMLGFYTSTCYGRWASVQQKEGDVQRAIHNISLRILWKTKFDLQKNDKDKDDNNDANEEGEKTTTTTFSMEEVRGIRSELVRLVNLSHGIAVRYLYEGISDIYDGHLLASGLLKEEERDFILLPKNSALCGSEYVIPLAWFQDYIGNLVKKEAFRFNDWTVEEFGSSIFDLQRTYDDLVRYKAEPVPLIYTQLVQITVR